MPRPPRISGRYPPRRSSSVGDDVDNPRQVNPAAVIAIVAVVVGAGLLVWVMSGGPTRRSAPPPPPAESGAVVIQPLPNTGVTNRPPRAEMRIRIDPRTPSQLEYSGAFSTDPDLQDEEHLTYAWDFGDGSEGVSTARGVHLYRRSGTFTVRVVVRDPAGAESTATKTVEVAPAVYQVTGRPRADEQAGLDARWLPLGRSERFAALDPRWGEATTFTVDKVDLDRRPREEWYALRFTGFIQFPQTGLWTLLLTSDDGGRLVLDGKTIISMDDYQAALTTSMTVEVMAPGLVPFRLEFYQGDNAQELAVEWAGPDLARQAIPASAFVRPAD